MFVLPMPQPKKINYACDNVSIPKSHVRVDPAALRWGKVINHENPVGKECKKNDFLHFVGAVIMGFSITAMAEPVNIKLPAQPLADSLVQFAKKTGISVAVDSALLAGKAAPALDGYWEPEEALRRLLRGSGLSVTMEGDTAVISRQRISAQITTDTVNVRASRFKQIGPTPGLALTKEEIPGNVQSITDKDIKEAHSLSLTDLMNSKLQSVNVNDYQSNPFQMDVTYRGFTASPQLGTSQGLSVFLDGTRINEPFGDVVNWDMIPMNALAGFDVIPGSNPIFGLGTLGGAISMKTKSGFDDPNVEADILAGSFGRKQLQASGGWNNGAVAAFGAINLFLEDGWRQNSPSKVNQAFGKLEWRNDKLSLALSTLGVTNKLTGNGTVPQELYNEDPTAVFTSPDETRNRLLQFQLAGIFDVSDTFSVTGQLYRRNSNRKSSTGDIIDRDTFRDLGYASRRPAPGQQVSCTYADNNNDGLADYYLYDQTGGAFNTMDPVLASYQFGLLDFNALPPTVTNFNGTLPTDFYSAMVNAQTNKGISATGNPGDLVAPSVQTKSGIPAIPSPGRLNYFVDRADPNTRHYILYAPATNQSTCLSPTGQLTADGTRLLVRDPVTNLPVFRDGAMNSATNNFGTSSGYVDGTPNAIITMSDIEQTTTGGALQLNWNLERHKFMLGASLDQAKASYFAAQRFGILDADRNVTSDPSQLGAEFLAASQDIPLNDFDGKSTTGSLYFSETWSPFSDLNISLSSRYNHSDIENKLAPARRGFSLASGSLMNRYAYGVICPNGVCPFDPSKPLTPAEYKQFIDNQFDDGSANSLAAAHTEEFSYHSFNPALGVTWQATPRLNLYGNLSQGTRLPSVIELGCAFDPTPVLATSVGGTPLLDATGHQYYRARSINDGRGCSLPNAMSGDPYLPQVTARTIEFGARGKFKDTLEWNISAYRTNLRDDIYLVSVTPELSFFQDVGETRRQGLEFGLAGEYGRSEYSINYSYTDATFQSSFKMLSPNNSSTLSNDTRSADFNMIKVDPGARLPGIPLNTINFNWGYRLTPALKVGFNVVAHGSSFLRGNENNKHTAGPGNGIVANVLNPSTGTASYTTVATPDYNYNGEAPGYTVVNFQGSYDLGKGWRAGLVVNNLLDKEYFSAGRLGLNPFAPSINGAIGASGFNYNSSEWQSTQFMSPGAPRGLWLSLSYDFNASQKSAPLSPTSTLYSPDIDHLPAASAPPTMQELAAQQAIQSIPALPVLNSLGNTAAEQQVAAAVQGWQRAWGNNDIAAYLQSYAPGFVPEGTSRATWEEQRKLQLATGDKPTVEISHLLVAPQGKRMTAVFTQVWRQQNYQETSKKILYLEQNEGRWLIIREHAAPLSATQPGSAGSLISGTEGDNKLKVSLNTEAK